VRHKQSKRLLASVDSTLIPSHSVTAWQWPLSHGIMGLLHSCKKEQVVVSNTVRVADLRSRCAMQHTGLAVGDVSGDQNCAALV
jgi:hypothetical protein